MVKPTEAHRVLCKSNVLFLGHSPPTPQALKLEALSDPLRKAYPAHVRNEVDGINAYLTIYTSGMQLQLVDGSNPLVFWFPIQNLYISAANKCVNYLDPATGAIRESKFVELASEEAQESSHAPLFSFISQQFRGTDIQCYTFLTKSDEAAFALVEATKFAYDNKSGHTKDRIPSEIAVNELVSDSDSGSEMSGTPNVVNVDSIRNRGESDDMFPRRLVKRQRLELLRPSQSFRHEDPFVPPLRVNNSINRSGYPSYRIPQAQPAPVYVPTASPRPLTAVKEKIKVVQPPPLYIRAPPPKVVYVKQPPQIVQTPPRIIRQVVEVDRPVERIKEVPMYIKSEPEIIEKEVPVQVPVEVKVPVPYPVRADTPPPRIVERQVKVEVPVPVEVPYPVRGPTPPPQIVEVPYEVRARTPPPRVVQVPVPYEVRAPTPPPQIIEVPVQVPVYIESEPQIIREPPTIQEIPVPYPVEVPYQVPVEVPHLFPVPLPQKTRRRHRRSRRREYYNDQLLDRQYGQGYFVPPEFHDLGYEVRRDNRAERPRRRRRNRSSSSDSSPARRREHRDGRDYGLSNGLSGIRITEVDDRGRPIRDDRGPRRDHRDDYERGRPQRGDYRRSPEREQADGYDFYRPSVGGRRNDRGDRRDDDVRDYRVRTRHSSPNNRSKYDRDFSPSSFTERRGYASQMPAHLSDSASDPPPPPLVSARSQNDAYYY